MDKDSKLLELENELNQLDSMIASAEKSSKDEKLASLESQLSQLDSQIAMKENPKSGFKEQIHEFFEPFGEYLDQGARGIGKNLDAISEAGRATLPKIESYKGESPENGEAKKRQTYIEKINESAGRDTKPTTAGGQFAENLTEYATPIFPGAAGAKAGALISPAIAGVSTGLRELGLDESYSDLIAALGVPNIKTLATLPGKFLKKLTNYLGTIGNEEFRRAGNVENAAKFLQDKVGETNIPDVVSKIENYETPFKGAVKVGADGLSEGEAAYRPLTADVAENVGLSQYHRAKAENIPEIGQKRLTNEEVLKREIDKLASESASPQVSQEFAAGERTAYQSGLDAEEMAARNLADEATNRFNTTSKIDEAGKSTQDYLAERTTKIKQQAQEKSKPLYDEAKAKILEGEPRGALDLIDEKIEKYSRTDPAQRDARRARIAIEHAAGNAEKEHAKTVSALKKQYKSDPGMLDVALKELEKNAPRGTYTGETLDTAKKTLKRIFGEIPVTETERRSDFNEIMKRFDKDMESIPEIFEARKVYADIMKPANAITEHPILGKLISQDSGFTRPFTVTHAEIPDRVIKGSKSIEGAKALMSEAAGAGTKEHKTMLETLKSYVNSDILSNFVETNGKVNPAKFEAWKKANPGAFILDPQLNKKLKNLENAQSHVDRVITQNEELMSNFYKKSMDKFLGPKFEGVDPDKIVGRILNSTNSTDVMKEAVELMSKDKSGNALEGLKRGIVKDLDSKFKSDKFTFATFNSYLDKNRKALSQIFNPDQMEVLEKSKDVLKKQAVMERAGKGSNSDSIPKLMENLAEKSGSKASEALTGLKMPGWLSGISSWAQGIADAGKLKYAHKALLDPKMAKFLLLKDTKTKRNFFDSLENKEDFGKWLRDSESLWKTASKAAGEIGDNFSITSRAVGKVLTNDDL